MKSKSFDPGKLMELAVGVMITSTQEPRSDGKANRTNQGLRERCR